MEKLIRDNIPEIVRDKGESIVIRFIQNKSEYIAFLLRKADEELLEFEHAPWNEKPEEASDVMEVYDSLIEAHDGVEDKKKIMDAQTVFMNHCISKFGMNIANILQIQANKRNVKGGFKKGIIGIF